MDRPSKRYRLRYPEGRGAWMDERRPPRMDESRLRRFVIVAAVLLLLIPVTMAGRSWYVDRIAENAGALQREAVIDALNEIELQFGRMQSALLERAEDLAGSSVVVNGLRTRARSNLSIGPADLVSYFSELELPASMSVEVYDAARRLVAWNGFSMSVDDAPAFDRSFRSFRTAIATDDEVRQALAVWWPVIENGRVLGGIRAMQQIGYDAPVRNEYLSDISLAQQWSRLTELPVEVIFENSAEAIHPQSRLLQGADGSILGRVSVDAPTKEALEATAVGRFNDVLAFWAVLWMFWVMGGIWWLYRRSRERMQANPRNARFRRTAILFSVAALLWWALRFALLFLNVPARWQQGKAPLSPLFDPIHLASDFAGGLMRSTGDLLLTSVFFLIFAGVLTEFALVFRNRSAHLYSLRRRIRRDYRVTKRSVIASIATVLAATLVIEGLTIVLALATRHVVLDSTFDFYARKGLLPEPLLLIVFSSLILLTIAVILISVSVVWIAASALLRRVPSEMTTWSFLLGVTLAAAIPLVVLYAAFPIGVIAPWTVSLALLALAVAIALYLMLREGSVAELFILRSILPSIFVVTVLLYPMLYNGMDAKRRIQMVDTAETFAEGRDPRALFAIDQMLRTLRSDDRLRDVLSGPRRSLDSLATGSIQGSLLASLPAYDVSLTFFDSLGNAVGRYFDTGQVLDRVSLNQVEPLEQNILRQMYEEGRVAGVLVATVTGTREPDRLQYSGITPLFAEGSDDVIGWITARAEPVTVLREGGTPFPRMLLPSGSYDDLFANLSIAEFRDGVLVRTVGRDFGRYRLSDDVLQDLAAESSVWRTDEVEGRAYRTYFHRQEHELDRPTAAFLPSNVTSIVAVRVPSINTFDHLYYLLRVTVAGLFIGLLLYLLGLYPRRRSGLLPAPRVRFRDKVMNAFLGVGIISVAAVGFVGLGVITGENERAVQSWLRQHLERVEETLALDARGEEMPYSVLDRIRIDSLSARVGLDLNVYQDYELTKLSRPQLVRDGLIDQRLPIEAYKALFFDGYRFVYTNERVGNFSYTAGFRALPDEQGSPQYVVSVPTLPEQERLEEERALTVAYLFGSLLLLVLLVMATASLLANAISRPIARLRSGLKAVAAGRFERMLPVDSRDEIGELVETFNEMQEQLAESRRKLTQQERQLAWREMARQVAHEIKNPLTPMKLSVQHLRRAYHGDDAELEPSKRFPSIFERITMTLIEQIDTLARIANEFHSFARMPSRILERLDLNAVVEEAVSLMQEESEIEITVDLHPEPLIVKADREELRRIYINLIKNAIQATPSEEGRVHVATDRPDEQTAYSSVTDAGEGIEEAVRDRIFEPNFSTKTSGTGLGLAIVKKGVEEMQGEIGFDTGEGEGTTFWIVLPTAQDGDDPVDEL